MMCEQNHYYVRKKLVQFEEDELHEFKGHRSIAIEELPPWCFQPGSDRRTRKSASRALAAFLNSARGGTVYLGIIDNGTVKGLYLTEYQKDHVLLSIKDVFSRYKPPVSDDCYVVKFVPVFGEDEEKIFPTKQQVDESTVKTFMKAHLLRTFDFCWCDKDLAKNIDEGVRIQDYVIEINLFPQKPHFQINKDGTFKSVIPVVYENEEGKCFFRKSASCVEYSAGCIQDLALQQLQDLYHPVITRLRNEVKILLEKRQSVS